MSTQPPESGEPEPASEAESQRLVREGEEAAKAATPKTEPTTKPPWWKFWAKR